MNLFRKYMRNILLLIGLLPAFAQLMTSCALNAVSTPTPRPPTALTLSLIPDVTAVRSRQSVVIEVASSGWENAEFQWKLVSDLDDRGTLSSDTGSSVVYQAPSKGQGNVEIVVIGQTDSYTGTGQIGLRILPVDLNVYRQVGLSESTVIMLDGSQTTLSRSKFDSHSSSAFFSQAYGNSSKTVLIASTLQENLCLLNETIQTVLSIAFNKCSELNNGWACLASGTAEVQPVEYRFHATRDRRPIAVLESVRPNPPDGIVVMRLSTAMGSPVYIVAFDTGSPTLPQRTEPFAIQMTFDEAHCVDTPPGMVLSGSGNEGTITVNDVDIRLN